MSAMKWMMLVGVLVIVALIVPFIPQTQSSGQFLGVQYQRSAIVSPSYYAFHCGAYVDSKVTAQLGYFFFFDYEIT